MSKLIPSNKSGVKPGSNERAGLRGNGHSNGRANWQSNGNSNGNGNGHADHSERAVPTVKARVPAEPRPISRPTQLIPLVDATQPPENGEVQRTIVRPVKARVGNGNGSHGNGNGN